jgi:uracil phosphoribosyltransferase
MRFSNLHIVDHPLASHILAQLRDNSTPPTEFRVLCKRLTLLLATEATRDLSTRTRSIQTPLELTDSQVFDETIVAVVILRAGLGMLDPIVELFPDVAVGYVGLERNETTAVASSYYAKLPPDTPGKTVLLLDPMLATGGSAAQACDLIASYRPKRIIMLAVVAAPEGVRLMQERHPGVQIFTASLDRELNDKSYILPGLGDFGDRLYGT